MRTLSLLVSLVICQSAHGQDRLKITVVPVYVFPNTLVEGTPPSDMYPIDKDDELVMAVHSAMADTLNVSPRNYDLVVAEKIELMDCTYAIPLARACASISTGPRYRCSVRTRWTICTAPWVTKRPGAYPPCGAGEYSHAGAG